jgi:hypothetical protein
MKRIVIASLGSLLLGTVLLTAGPGYVPSRDYTGIITDSMCGADHAKMQLTPENKCVQECVRNGAKYALLVGQNIYILSDQKGPSKFAAQKVTIAGNLNSKKNVLTALAIRQAK